MSTNDDIGDWWKRLVEDTRRRSKIPCAKNGMEEFRESVMKQVGRPVTKLVDGEHLMASSVCEKFEGKCTFGVDLKFGVKNGIIINVNLEESGSCRLESKYRRL